VTVAPFAPLPPFEVVPRRQVYLGLDPQDAYRPCWSATEDSVGVVGPPRYGKSSGVIIPAIMTWDGAVVATSTRGDLLHFSANWRFRLAAARGGDVYVYDPFGSEPGVSGLRWSPLAGCTDPSVCYRRVAAMTAVVARGITDGEHWRAGAAVILRAMFHAAALEGRNLLDVRRWLAEQDTIRNGGDSPYSAEPFARAVRRYPASSRPALRAASTTLAPGRPPARTHGDDARVVDAARPPALVGRRHDRHERHEHREPVHGADLLPVPVHHGRRPAAVDGERGQVPRVRCPRCR
jgi:hypothetical protein